MKILITNDDGIHAPGIRALVEAVPRGMEVVVAAPATERSASSHSITLGQKLRVEEFDAEGIRNFAVHGTPADSVKFAVAAIEGFSPDIVISGINQGANTGISVYYSGTISAAREGFINRVPAIAVSLCSRSFQDFSSCIEISRRLLDGYAAGKFPKNVMLNVNVPPLSWDRIRGIKITKQANSRFIEEFIPEKEHDGKKVFSLAGEIEVIDPDGTSDEEAVTHGYISITPLKIDLTEHKAIPIFETWVRESGIKRPEEKSKSVHP
jgi:5'-nucleotidase